MNDETEYFISNLISDREIRDLIYWKNLCKKQLEDYDFEAMMIRKYFQCSFYKKCRAMSDDQLSERLWELNNNRIPWEKQEMENAERKLFLNHQAREKLQTEMMPYAGVDFKNTPLIQKQLFL